jgi:DNA-binding transcriptional MerR regulator
MAYKEKEIEKVYYSIGEVSEMFNVAPSLIRFWESEFELIQPKKNRKR